MTSAKFSGQSLRLVDIIYLLLEQVQGHSWVECVSSVLGQLDEAVGQLQLDFVLLRFVPELLAYVVSENEGIRLW